MDSDQIIKALECCASDVACCSKCPYEKFPKCMGMVRKNALSLINELTEENERLRAEGEWLPQFEGARIVKCSVCGYEYCDLIECGNYCGNCGAKMKGGE